jgi:hypothetical protein
MSPGSDFVETRTIDRHHHRLPPTTGKNEKNEHFDEYYLHAKVSEETNQKSVQALTGLSNF